MLALIIRDDILRTRGELGCLGCLRLHQLRRVRPLGRGVADEAVEDIQAVLTGILLLHYLKYSELSD
jgi:hypothetical protein